MSRFIQQSPSRTTEKKKPERTLPKAGSYSAKDLSAKGVRSGVWEKKDDA